MVLRGRWGSCLLAKQVEVYVRGRQLYLLSSRFQKFKLLVIWIFCLAIPLLHTSKVRLVKAMVFLAVMYECESWTVKKAELWRIDAFELSCWRRLLRVPWTARRSNQSILKEIGPGISLEGRNDVKAEAPVLWPPHATHWKRLWGWEGLGAEGGDDRGWDGWMASPIWWKWLWVSSGSWWWTGRPGVLQLMGLQRVRHNWATELNWFLYSKDWRQEEKGETEDEMVGWHHWLTGHEFEQTPRCSEGQGCLACHSPWGLKE